MLEEEKQNGKSSEDLNLSSHLRKDSSRLTLLIGKDRTKSSIAMASSVAVTTVGSAKRLQPYYDIGSIHLRGPEVVSDRSNNDCVATTPNDYQESMGDQDWTHTIYSFASCTAPGDQRNGLHGTNYALPRIRHAPHLLATSYCVYERQVGSSRSHG